MAKTTPFAIVLVNPEIPQNTGNIARLCAATGSELHLVGKLGFSLDEKAVRRAGLDYWHLVKVYTHENFNSCMEHLNEGNPIIFSSRGQKSYTEAPFIKGSTLVYGAESVGLPSEITDKYSNNLYGIPTLSNTVRSLNLANSVAITLYKGLESIDAFNILKLMP
ncbi:MAG: tRNA (cytidine(34)-2'-O)-methyltransferase [Deltaproteobacteria bacterium]|nr:tRNA (cytidine(34)-2'-O)-methyltransferase [Deltaproteobacteria bacterium]